VQFHMPHVVQQVSMCFVALGAATYSACFGPLATMSGHEVENRMLEINKLWTEQLDNSLRLARQRWHMVP
jgi:hypothetical protein